MLEAPPSALTRVRDDAADIYAVTDVAPVPIGARHRGRRMAVSFRDAQGD